MEDYEPTITESTRDISRLYYDDVNVEKAVEVMRGRNTSSELVKSIYTQLSKEADELRETFYYYSAAGIEKYWLSYRVGFWKSRYLITNNYGSTKSAYRQIGIIDLFNNKSM
jgi:hypothetical protein